MSTKPEHVRPRPKPQALQLGTATQLPGRPDELGDMGRELVEAVQVVGAEAAVQAAAEALGGFGRVLGDVAGHLLSRQLPGPVIPRGDVADVELLTPAGIPLRPVVQGWAGHPDGRDRRLQGVLEQVGAERLRWWQETGRASAVGRRVQADDGVEVDRPASLELSHLGIGDPDQTAQLPLLEADQSAEGTLDGDGGPSPQLGGERVPEHLRLTVVAGRAERLPKPRVVLGMPMPAAIPHTMGTAGTLAMG